MVRDSVIYPVILEKLEDEIAIINQGGFYMPDIHIVLLELTEINDVLRKSGIKIYEHE